MSAVITKTENYVLGSGSLTFRPEGETGELDLGNCPSFTITSEVENFEHKESRTSKKLTDLTLPIGSTLAAEFQSDSMNDDVIALFFASVPLSAAQSATAITAEVITRVHALREYQLGATDLLPSGAQKVTAVTIALSGAARANTAAYAVGAQIVVASRVYVATVAGVSAGAAPTFNFTTIGEATVDGGVTWAYVAAAITLVAATDYNINPTSARFGVRAGGVLAVALTALVAAGYVAGLTVTSAYTPTAGTRTRISAGEGTQVKGMLRFISDNTNGANRITVIPLVTLSASGSLEHIGTELQTVTIAAAASKKSSAIPLMIIDGIVVV